MDSQELVQHFAEQSHPDELEQFDRASLEELVAKHETPFMVLDLEEVDYQYKSLQAALPGVKLFYALKSLSHPELIKRLKGLGCHFDLATIGEVELVESLGIKGDQCIHTHPIKKDKEIKRALEFGCKRFVVDNFEEMKKFYKYAGQVELIIRVSFRSKQAVVDLSRKFGCSLEELPVLVEMAQSNGIEVVGLSFHVGSQSLSPATQVNAIRSSVAAMKVMNNVKWKFLDIGGSFPVSYQEEVTPIEEFCAPVMEALSELPEHIEVFAEPGRFISAPSMIEVVSVVGKAKRGSRTWYYLDDGVYGGFSGQMFDHASYPIAPLKPFDPLGEFYPSVLAGPTCDSIDVVAEDIELPELEVGDILIGKQMGAYTIASATEFNYYPKPKIVVVEDIFDPTTEAL
ncbi:type III PLP-dependent enzyme [Hydrogenovibrio marinus]|uniref:ornithine decarboxylase n=1 Tax=Hydrogenovibrio marinus TaxID=28885 RepID=A0A066ZPR1_HYDMR|nr:type III PLP-dependent enzyme [Hydrogenovibrio marinus]KDN95793.1 ornithine decarboxylase [Hydrogenovibrio marinus]BBN58720.1 ornithine decarboxylase [Hydrogenovibrio marinus]